MSTNVKNVKKCQKMSKMSKNVKKRLKITKNDKHNVFSIVFFHFSFFHVFHVSIFSGGVAVFPSHTGGATFLLLLCVGLLFSPVFCWVVLRGLLLLWVELRFPSTFAWCCLPFALWVEMRSSPLLFGGAAWSPPRLDGVPLLLSFCVVLLGFLLLVEKVKREG